MTAARKCVEQTNCLHYCFGVYQATHTSIEGIVTASRDCRSVPCPARGLKCTSWVFREMYWWVAVPAVRTTMGASSLPPPFPRHEGILCQFRAAGASLGTLQRCSGPCSCSHGLQTLQRGRIHHQLAKCHSHLPARARHCLGSLADPPPHRAPRPGRNWVHRVARRCAGCGLIMPHHGTVLAHSTDGNLMLRGVPCLCA